MRKLLLICCICLSCLFANAQLNKELTDFQTYSREMSQKVSEASKTKNNEAGIAETNEWLDHYNNLSPEAKKSMMDFTQNMYYNLACFSSLEGKKAVAIIYFKRSIAEGFSDYKHASVDSDLDNIRNESKFKDALQQLHDKFDYGYILKQAGPYTNSTAALPAFTYQSSSAPELVELKTKFNLDSVSGNGDEISRMKNLLHWVHNEIRHDGNSGNPKSKNAADLIAVCKKENRGVNCRMMATTLRDVYQAEGFQARIVTCMPKDTNDFDCHVINVVWSKTLNKWLWMDPTFNAYVSDSKGNLLNIEEVRERLVKGSDDLVLNDDANWNNKEKETKDYYLGYYMSKNLYWIKCSAKSEWDLETRKPGMASIEYINLYPGNYTTIFQPKKANGDMVEYAANNPVYFWQKPQIIN
ncbi:Transglutaminase-like superfamily protein [Mucilaginibacter mallensis]|uniref:Transglutaminase-like superfamily protein n=1 Tax=Mucilaginibacter mallensis TaxID=652787 RepID=A0A1H1VPC6_MUCMA|nr:transglutaminase domain-containing protein [Mucilaginibacter mallensis]SDS86603.1 Transglutaminase-like superfamily protein [Mucilaginibacter mallensis]